MKRGFLLLPVVALLLDACLPPRLTLPQSPALKWLERKTGRIALIDVDGNVRSMDQAGGSVRMLTQDASIPDDPTAESSYYQYPAWSPDGRSIAFVGVRRKGTAPEAFTVWTERSDGTGRTELFTSDHQMPRLLSWAPDSSTLVFLAAEDSGGGEKLESVPARGGTPIVLASGSSHAWRWGRASRTLALHAIGSGGGAPAERVAFVDSSGAAGEQDLSVSPARFEAPGWMADNTGIIVAVRENDSSVLYLEDRNGGAGKKLATVAGGVTFDVSPDGRTLAYTTMIPADQPGVSSLSVLDLGARAQGRKTAGAQPAAPKVISGEDAVAAFFWSPDSTHIAYLVPSAEEGDQGASIVFTLKILRVRTGAVRTVATFHPSGFFLQMVREFSQYGESLRMWSPDSRFVVYSALDSGGPVVMVAYADQPIAPRKITDGLMATWSAR